MAFLARAGIHPVPTEKVTVVETHFAHVFLTDTLVYKLKKPRRYPMVDLSSLESRRHACEEEIRLNRDLAPAAYLGLSVVTVDASGRLALDGAGRPVDYLVRMCRLDQDDCLQTQLALSGPSVAEVDLAATRLARYYQACRRQSPITAPDRRQRWQLLCDELDSLMGQRGMASTLHGRLLAWLENNATRLDTRWAIDAHGDLRPEHIYLGTEPVFIDRLEFNPALRIMDPQEELAFLTMECNRLGGRWVGERFFSRYYEITGDSVIKGPRLLL